MPRQLMKRKRRKEMPVRKTISKSLILYEIRNVLGNPYIWIFGVGFPIFFMFLMPMAVTRGMTDASIIRMVTTSLFLSIGALIPMANMLMGYGISCAQEMEKGVPQRLELFGISRKMTLCNRAISEGIFFVLSFLLYGLIGMLGLKLEAPAASGVMYYAVCMLLFGIICFAMGHGIACLLRKFSLTYCVMMILYFGFMVCSGMMGISYEDMPKAMKAVANLIPVTYITKDFYTVWTGKSYNFMPMIQSYLFLGAVAGIVLFAGMKRK